MALLQSECCLGRHAGAVGGGLAGGPLQDMLGPCVAGKAGEGVPESSCPKSQCSV